MRPCTVSATPLEPSYFSSKDHAGSSKGSRRTTGRMVYIRNTQKRYWPVYAVLGSKRMATVNALLVRKQGRAGGENNSCSQFMARLAPLTPLRNSSIAKEAGYVTDPVNGHLQR